MGRAKFIVIGIIAVILLLQGITNGAFLSMIIPGWEEMLGHFFCIAGGFIVQPVWDLGWMKLPLPTHDDLLVGLILGSIITWLILKRVEWKFWKKLVVWLVTVAIGIYLYKAIGLIFLYWAEVTYGLSGCIGEFTVGPFGIRWEWFDFLFWIMLFFTLAGAITAVLAWKRKESG